MPFHDSKQLFAFILLLGLFPKLQVAPAADKPQHIVVIIIDDLNDWIGCLGAHPQVQTPNIDRLARRGMLFTNAHVQATFCGPSRVSLLSGRMPQTTGCRDFDRYEALKSLEGHAPFPLHFRRLGYETLGGGKIFHHGTGDGWVAECWTSLLPSGPNPSPSERMNWPQRIWDWGPWPEENSAMGDFRLAQATAKVLRVEHETPLFVVAGFRRPHVPLHVPSQWFDLYPRDKIVLPNAPANDLSDVPHPELGTEGHAAPSHSQVVQDGLWPGLVQAYLASISFVDHCVGEILSGVDQGPNRDQTLVILCSDHGFHLGEKQHWAKRTLWEETTRIPLIIAGPGIAAGARSSQPVGLIDLYPTLCDLSELPMPDGLEGRSLRPLLDNPQADWPHPALTTFNPDDLSVRTEHWRYIIYPDGSEELYDHRNDPHEWRNLAGDPEHLLTKQELSKLAIPWK